jgi:TonB dependent receptor-like, beta-barrel
VGGDYEDIDYQNIIQRTGPSFTLPDGQATVTGAQIQILPDSNVGQFYRVVRANTSNVRDTRAKYFDFFAQDTWRATDRLTLRGGLRYEQQKLAGTIIKDFSLTGNWAPRVGATYDLLGNGKSKLYANWGRFYAKIPNDLAARALSSDAGISRADYYDANLTQPIPDGVDIGGVTTHFIQQGQGADTIDPNVKSTYLDEFLTGFEYELLPDMNVGVRWIHRRFGRVLEDISPYPLVACDLGIDAACSVDYTLTNPGAGTATLSGPGLQPASFEDPVHDYDPRVHGRQAVLAELVGAGVVPVVAALRDLRGLLPG